VALWEIVKVRQIEPEGREDPDDKIYLVSSQRADGGEAKTKIVLRRATGVTNAKRLVEPFLDDQSLPSQIFKLEDQTPHPSYQE
jgi:hypothetical protein